VRVAFFGLPLAALLLSRDGHDVVYAGICRVGAAGTRRLRARLGDDRVVVKPNVDARDTLARVGASRPDLVVSWFWTTRLPPTLLALAPLGAIGAHPSMLPRHRGPDPYFWAIEKGDVETGVTVHLLGDDYDTGAIVAARRLAIDPTWSAWTLAKRLDRPSLALLREVVGAYADGRPPAPTPQDDAHATLAPVPGDELLEIIWASTAAEVVRRVRAASPWPGAFTELGGQTLAITRARETADIPRTLTPGEAFVRADGVAVVAAGTGGVELLAGRSESDDRDLDARELASLVLAARGGAKTGV
jgi:methionyl-tRNA formyltransferase